MRQLWPVYTLLLTLASPLLLAPPSAAAPLPGGGSDGSPRFADLVIVDDEADEDAEGETKLVPAKFNNLRFEEDWSQLGEPGVTTNHWFPEMKHVEMGDEWTASFGGQLRYRYMDEYNKNLMKTSPRNNRFNLSRVRAHADLRHSSGFRVFVEGLDARIWDEDKPALGIDRNNADFQNAFLEYGSDGITGRVGRMELQQGAQRLISPLDWGNTRRTFQGGLVRMKDETQKTDIFWTRPIMVDARDYDTTDSSRSFAGVYHTFDAIGGGTADLFGLMLDDDDRTYAGGSGTDDLDVYTIGGRYRAKTGDTDYEAWGAYQFGDYGEDDIGAYAWTLAVGHTFPNTPGTPRIGVDVDFASGDDDPTDDDHGTFNQLFPLGHKYLGHLDLVGRQNIMDVSPSVAVKLDERTSARAAYHVFTLAEREDALYNAGGGSTFDDPTGAASKDVGQEIDFTVAYKPKFLDPHGHVLVGYAKFFADDRMDDLGGSGNADIFYVQFTMTF